MSHYRTTSRTRSVSADFQDKKIYVSFTRGPLGAGVFLRVFNRLGTVFGTILKMLLVIYIIRCIIIFRNEICNKTTPSNTTIGVQIVMKILKKKKIRRQFIRIKIT